MPPQFCLPESSLYAKIISVSGIGLCRVWARLEAVSEISGESVVSMIPASRCRVAILLTLLFWVGLSFSAPFPLVAASPPPLGVAPLSLVQNPAVEMTSLRVDAYLKDVGGRTVASVKCQYRLRNTDP